MRAAAVETGRMSCRFVLGLLMAALLAACGSDKEEPPPRATVDMNVVAAPTLNPDLNGRPSPVVVRFYQLATTELFNNVDFFQLFEQDQAALGPTSLARQDHVFQPGQIEKLNIGIKDGVTALGVVVAFRNYDRALWRATVPVMRNVVNAVDLQILSQSVQMKVTSTYVPTPTSNLCTKKAGCTSTLAAAPPPASGQSVMTFASGSGPTP